MSTQQPYGNEAQELAIAIAMAEAKQDPEDVASALSDMHEDQPPLPKKRTFLNQRSWPLYRLRHRFREYFAEFFGDLILLSFGLGVVATTKFIEGDAAASYLAITMGWGAGLTIALYVSMGVSGGHLNPAVTLGNCLFGTFPWRKFPGFVAAQLLGAMTGAACVYGLFSDHFAETKKTLAEGETMTDALGGIFCTYPNVKLGSAVWSEFFCTMLMMMGILGITDDRMTPAINHKPIAIGLLIFVLGVATGWNTGYAMNPARDLGPRLVSAMLFGSDPFTKDNHYFWVPTFIPFFGAAVGMFLYSFFIIPNDNEEE